MCVISGYLGKNPAAPILLEILKREEGFAGGFYTGVTTLHNGQLHCRKVVGDVETLIRETDVLDLPGTVGIAHSRTPGGGVLESSWAHPFLDPSSKLAFMGNGARGMYNNLSDFHVQAQRLKEKGFQFSSIIKGGPENHPIWDEEHRLHTCEVFTGVLADAYAQQAEAGPLEALMAAYRLLPGSFVGVCLHADYPDEISAVRNNKPLEIARLTDGSIVFASAALAFPQGVEWRFRTPAFTGVRISRSGELTLRPLLGEQFIPLGPAPSPVEVVRILEEKLGAGMASPEGVQVRDFIDAFIPLWPEGCLNEKEVLAFEVMRSLVVEGKAEIRSRRMPGVAEGLTAPQSFMHSKGGGKK